MGPLPRLSLTRFERAGVAGNHLLARDLLAYCDVATDRRQRAYDVVREHHALTAARVDHRNSALPDALHPGPKFAVARRAWVYNAAATPSESAKPGTDAEVLHARFSFNWTSPYNIVCERVQALSL